MIEEWKTYNTVEISNYGRVKRKNNIITYSGKPGKYISVRCGNKERKFLHKLVAELFIPNPENKPQIDHIDSNTLNNRVDNLRWVTQSENNSNPHWIYKQKLSQSNSSHKLSKPFTEEHKLHMRKPHNIVKHHWKLNDKNKRVYY